jgi:RNA methyltransferase, TrmH family
MSALAFDNTKVQQLRRLLGRRSSRHDEGRFVVEGATLAMEAVAAGWTCEAQFVPEGSGAVVDGAGDVFELAPGVFERVASTRTPQAPLVVVQMPSGRDAPALLVRASLVAVLHQVGDPGNLGTILRSAEAAGADLVVLTPGSVDPYNPKVVRSSAGALFHLPVVTATPEEVAAAGLVLWGTTSHDATGRTVTPHIEADLRDRVAIVFGNEAAGLPDDWTDTSGPVRRWLTVEHTGRGESLNVAMAATVVLFEAARQRST